MCLRAEVPPSLEVGVLDECQLVFHGISAMLGPHVRRVRHLSSGPTRNPGRAADVTLWDPAGGAGRPPAGPGRVLSDGRYGRVVLYSFHPLTARLEELVRAGHVRHVDKAASAEVLLEAVLGPGAGRPAVGGVPVPSVPAAWPGQEHGLSRREAQMLALITQGLTNAEISDRTHLSTNTVKTYVRSAYRKLGLDRRSEAVRWGVQKGLHLVGGRHP